METTGPTAAAIPELREVQPQDRLLTYIAACNARFIFSQTGFQAYVCRLLEQAEAGLDKRIVLGSRALVPAFADTHIHFSSWSFFLSSVGVRHAASNAEIAALLAKASAASPGSKPLLAFGASAHSVQEHRLVSRADLDAALPDRPVMVFKYDGHACVCNRAMLAALPTEVRTLRGMHEDSGELNQEAFFRATDFVTRSVSPLGLLRGMLRGYDTLAAQGIGMIHSAEGVGFPKDLDVTVASFVARGLKSPFRTRLFFQTMDVDRVLRRGFPRIGGCFATALDGCFGSKDAALLEPTAMLPAPGACSITIRRRWMNSAAARTGRGSR